MVFRFWRTRLHWILAVVGIACKFPGANDIDEFWEVLVNGENHVREVPNERWSRDAFFSKDHDEPGKTYVNRAALIDRLVFFIIVRLLLYKAFGLYIT